VTRRKPLQDSPTRRKPVAAMLFARLQALNGSAEYAAKAQETLETFAGVVEHFGLYASTYALALERMVTPQVQVCVIGDDAAARGWRRRPRRAMRRTRACAAEARAVWEAAAGAAATALEQTLLHLPRVQGSFALVCSGHSCQTRWGQ